MIGLLLVIFQFCCYLLLLPVVVSCWLLLLLPVVVTCLLLVVSCFCCYLLSLPVVGCVSAGDERSGCAFCTGFLVDFGRLGDD